MNETESEEEEEEGDPKFTHRVKVLWLEALAFVCATASCAFCILVCGVSWRWRDDIPRRIRQRMKMHRDKHNKVFVASKRDVNASQLLQ